MRRAGLSAWIVAAGIAGCATPSPASRAAGPTEAAVPEGPRPTPLSERERTEAMQRLYSMGERYYDVGDYVRAVALWRQVFLLLPPGPEGDRLRHEVIARMAHGLIAAHERWNDPDYLTQAEAVLERYLDKHQLLFPEGARAQAERAEIYELVGAIAALRARGEAGSLGREEGSEELAANTGDGGDDEVARAFDALHEHVASHAGETVGEDGIAREIVVPRRRRLASLDEPRVRAWLSHPSPMGPSILSGGDEPYNPTRPLVRGGLSSVRTPDADHRDEQLARRQLREALRAARPRLERCYAEALTRAPVLAEKLAVSVTIDGAGRVAQVQVASGRLVDAVGDACVIWAFMEAAPLPAVAIADDVTLELPVTFFVQPERRLQPSFLGGSGSPGDALAGYAADRATAFDGPP